MKPFRLNESTKDAVISASKSGQVWQSELFRQLAFSCFPARPTWYLNQLTAIPERTIRRHLAEGCNTPGGNHVVAYFAAGEFGAMLNNLMIFQQANGLSSQSPMASPHSVWLGERGGSRANTCSTFPKDL